MKATITLIGIILTAISSYARPYIVGHRGSYWAVENTAEAFKFAATRGGWEYIETDVKVTKDGEFICWHDDDLSRVAEDGDTYTIAGSTLETLKSIELKQTRGDNTYTGRITTIAEYLDICKEYNILPLMELKWATGINSNDQSNIPKLIKLIEDKGFRNTCIILTSMRNCLTYINDNYPDIQLQHLFSSDAWNDEATINYCQTRGIDMDLAVGTFSDTDVTNLHQKGIRVNCWTVNTTSNYNTYNSKGVDFVTTDYLESSEIPDYDDEAGVPTKPIEKGTITCQPTELIFDCVIGSSETIFQDISVKAEGVSTAITANSPSRALKISKLAYWNNLKGGTVRATLNNNFSTTPKVYESKINISSATGNTIEIPVTINFTDQAGIESTTAECIEIKYYNLQGIRINNPSGQLVIKRQGNNISKIIIK